MSGKYRAFLTLTNETEGHAFSEFFEDVPDDFLNEDGTLNLGDIFRALQREWGVCRSKVYVDGPPTKAVGWYFEKRERYEDTGERYLRGAWVTIRELTAPTYVSVAS